MMKSFILMPVYNGTEYIKDVLEKINLLHLSVLVVDDGSIDDSADVARAYKAEVIKHEVNQGKGAAIRTGISHLKGKEYDVVIMMDSDGQHEPHEIEHFIKKYKESEAPVIIGNRMTDTKKMPLLRKLTNQFMSSVISKICRQNIPDSQCGFRLISKEVIDNIDLESSNYEIESEMLIKAAAKGYRIESIPISTVYRHEQSYINPFIDTVRFTKLLFNVFFLRK